MIALKLKIDAALHAAPGTAFTAESLAAKLSLPERTETIFKVLEHLAANPGNRVTKVAGKPWPESTYTWR